MCPKKQLPEGLEQARGSAPMARAGSQVTARIPGAGCRDSECLYHPKTGVHGYLPENSKLNSPATRRRPQIWEGVSDGWKVCAGT